MNGEMSPSDEQVHQDTRAAYDRALASLQEAKRALAQAQQRSALAEERATALAKLIELDALEAGGEASEGRVVSPPPTLLDACEAAIRQNGGEMRLTDLREALLADGVPLPGKGTCANLFGRLERSGGRIVRVRRGVYGLASADETSRRSGA